MAEDQRGYGAEREGGGAPAMGKKEAFSQNILPILDEVRQAFDEITPIGEGSGDFIDLSVSDYAEIESNQKNQDLNRLITDVKALVDKILKKEVIHSGVKDRRLKDIESIRERMVELSGRFQSDERGLRGVPPHPFYGQLEADIANIYDKLTTALEDVEKYLEAR